MSELKVAIVDFHLGNLFSVKNACRFVGLEPSVVTDKDEILKSDLVILPGVGSFGTAMENLRKLDLVAPLKDYINSGKMFVGICLGMQLLFSESAEFGRHKGLDIIPGNVVRFPNQGNQGELIKVPQVGWNKIMKGKKTSLTWANTILDSIPEEEYMYFVHSFYVVPVQSEQVFCQTTYEGLNYCSGVSWKNVHAFQFHPEKSGPMGLKIYKNFKKILEERNDSA